MENTSRLYDTLVAVCGQSPAWRDRRHLQTLAWMLVGWLSAAQAGLCAWIPYVHSRAQQAQSVQRRFRRWLANARIDVDALYGPLIQAALSAWGEAKLYLALDTTLLWDQICLVRVAVIYRGRAIPLVWQTWGYSSNAVAFAAYAPLLRQAARLLPPTCAVTLLADRAFADVRLLTLLDTELHWHWRIRIKHHITVRRKGFYRRRLASVLPPPGHACFWHNVYVFEECYGPVHLALARPAQDQEEWLVLSDSPTSLATFTEYGLRFDIEENFLDDKSNGFQLQASQLRDPRPSTGWPLCWRWLPFSSSFKARPWWLLVNAVVWTPTGNAATATCISAGTIPTRRSCMVGPWSPNLSCLQPPTPRPPMRPNASQDYQLSLSKPPPIAPKDVSVKQLYPDYAPKHHRNLLRCPAKFSKWQSTSQGDCLWCIAFTTTHGLNPAQQSNGNRRSAYSIRQLVVRFQR